MSFHLAEPQGSASDSVCASQNVALQGGKAVIVVVMEFCDMDTLLRAIQKKAFQPHGKWSAHTTYVSYPGMAAPCPGLERPSCTEHQLSMICAEQLSRGGDPLIELFCATCTATHAAHPGSSACAADASLPTQACQARVIMPAARVTVSSSVMACDFVCCGSQRALLRTAQEVAKGLDYIHSCGIIHGDLKVRHPSQPPQAHAALYACCFAP